MIINKRLKMVGDLVDKSSTILDIGCDHAFLDIYLVKKNIGIKAIASDIAEGPLEQAKNNIKKEKLDKKIELRLGSGLDTYSDDIDTVIISGMGGRNMIGIFESNKSILKKIKTIIISPNNYQEDIRKYLCKNGFYVVDEKLVKDGKFIYQIMKFYQGKVHCTKKDYFFGPILIRNKDKLFEEYYTRELVSRKIILGLLPSGHFFRKRQLKLEIKMLEEELPKK